MFFYVGGWGDSTKIKLIPIRVRFYRILSLGTPASDRLWPQLFWRTLNGFKSMRIIYHSNGVQVLSTVANLYVTVFIWEFWLKALSSRWSFVFNTRQTGVCFVTGISCALTSDSIRQRKQNICCEGVAAFERVRTKAIWKSEYLKSVCL